MEEWKQLPYHSGQFYISNKGRVKNILTGNYLTGDINNAGYKRVGMYENSKRVRKFIHRLVAKAFIPNPNNLPQVNHIDGDKYNNTVDNLEWVNQSDNEIHAFNKGLKSTRPIKCVVLMEDGKEYEFPSLIDISRHFDVSETTVHNWVYRKNKSYRNYSIKRLTTIPW